MSDWDYEFICGLATRVFLLDMPEIADDGFKTLNPSIADIEMLHPEKGIIRYDDVFKSLYSHMGKKFVGELRRQLWQRNPEKQRLSVIDLRISRQHKVIEDLEDRIFKKEIANLWLQREPARRLHKWKNALYVIDGRKLAIAWFKKKAKMRGLRSWLEYVPAKRKRKRIKYLVKRHIGRKLEQQYIREWRKWTDVQVAIYEASLKRSLEVYYGNISRKQFQLWKANAKNIAEERAEQLQKAIKLWTSNSLEFCFHRWKDNAVKQVADKAAEYRQMQFMLSMDMGDQEAERKRMEREEKLMREFLTAEAKQQEEEEFKAMWDAQRHKTNETLKEHEMERQRLKYKQAKVQDKLDHDANTWGTLATRASEKAEKEAREYMTTKEGKKYLKQLVKEQQMKTEEDLQLEITNGSANLPNCKWQVMKEGATGIMKDKVFWFNSDTMARIYDDSLTLKHQKDIALERFVALKCHETFEKAKVLQDQQQTAYYEDLAARKIQNAYRNLKTRRVVRRAARHVWEKAIDPESGLMFYRNKKTGDAKWEKPKIFGSDELPDPPIWCVRINESGKYYYFNRVNEDMSSNKPPKGFILCCNCQTMFANRRCMSEGQGGCSGARFCDGCSLEYHRIPARQEHEVVECKVKQALCKICQSAGQRICYDCVGEVYCDRCYKLVHQAGDLATHTNYDLIK